MGCPGRKCRGLGIIFEDDEAYKDPNQISDADRMRPGMAIRAGLRRVENIYLHVQGGILEPEALERVGYGWYKSSFARHYWRAARPGFDEKFALLMDEKIL